MPPSLDRPISLLWLLVLLFAGCSNGTAATQSARSSATAEPRNVIFFLGDGMGISTITAARILAGQQLGQSGEEHELAFERFANVALIKTYNTDAQVPDSAGTMSALMTGQKTGFGLLSVTAAVGRGDCPAALANKLPTLLQQAEAAGLRSGIISTARITHATPAATYAHSPDRDWEDNSTLPEAAAEAGCIDIAQQMVNPEAGDGIELMLGGGRANFMPEGAVDPEYSLPVGRRTGAQDLIAQWQQARPQRRYVWNRADFLAAMKQLKPGVGQLLGLFEPSHMQWEADRQADAEPSLAEMTAAAIDFLSADNPAGYFLMVEGGRIDHAHHLGNAYRALVDTLALDAAVEAALAKVDLSQTLIVVTADHSHTLTISGYQGRGNPILGHVALPDGRTLPDAEGNPYTTLGYANGPGAKVDHSLEESADPNHPDYQQTAAVPLASETHAGEDVAAYATGRNASAVRGVMEQNRLYHVMYRALFGADAK